MIGAHQRSSSNHSTYDRFKSCGETQKLSERLVSTGTSISREADVDRSVRGHRQKVESCSALCLALWLSLGHLQASRAGINAGETVNPRNSQSPPEDYFSNWFKRVDETLAEQPHWIAPIFLTTPLLTELYRYDQNWQHLSNGGGNLKVFGTGKGLELIPAKTIQLIFGVPLMNSEAGSMRPRALATIPSC